MLPEDLLIFSMLSRGFIALSRHAARQVAGAPVKVCLRTCRLGNLDHRQALVHIWSI